MKNTNTTLVLWFLAAILALTAACGRKTIVKHYPTAATQASPAATLPEPLVDEAVQPKKPAPAFTPDPAPAPASTTGYLVHWVNGGDTLGSIAFWYTGREDNWRRLVQANPDIQPLRMPIGTQVRIPEDLLIRREPMPRSVQPSSAKKETPPATGASEEMGNPAPPADDVALFGPIESLPQPDEANPPLELETLD